MLRTIYHGSKDVVQKPIYGAGKTYNDYGLGFYCTENIDLAKEWSVNINRDGYANIYQIDDTDLNILNLNSPKYCILHWLGILIENREFDSPSVLAAEAKDYILTHFKVDYQKYDIIIGYRADDSYFSFAQDFLNGTISYRQLGNAMRLGKLGEQYVLKSKKAFDCIKYIGNEPVFASEWYVKKSQRDKAARKEYFSVEKNKRKPDDLYITKIIDEEMTTNDPRL